MNKTRKKLNTGLEFLRFYFSQIHVTRIPAQLTKIITDRLQPQIQQAKT
jgi:hypothetical protein